MQTEGLKLGSLYCGLTKNNNNMKSTNYPWHFCKFRKVLAILRQFLETLYFSKPNFSASFFIWICFPSLLVIQNFGSKTVHSDRFATSTQLLILLYLVQQSIESLAVLTCAQQIFCWSCWNTNIELSRLIIGWNQQTEKEIQ